MHALMLIAVLHFHFQTVTLDTPLAPKEPTLLLCCTSLVWTLGSAAKLKGQPTLPLLDVCSALLELLQLGGQGGAPALCILDPLHNS